MATVYQVRAEKLEPGRGWVAFHSSERFTDEYPHPKLKATAEGIRGLLLELGDIEWRDTQITDEAETFTVPRLFTRDGHPVRIQMECWPEVAAQC